MDIGTIVFWVLLIGAAFFFAWFATLPAESGEVKIVMGSQDGKTLKVVRPKLPLAFNQPEGLTYSYSAWLLFRDFGSGYGQQRTVFSQEGATSLLIDSTSNSLIVGVETFGTRETILIPNIPAMKWIQFSLVVDQQSVDIYINGILRQHHTLGQLPKQSDKEFRMGPGWDGVLADLTYYSRALNVAEIKRLTAKPVPDDMSRAPAPPQYFDISWYIGRLYSK